MTTSLARGTFATGNNVAGLADQQSGVLSVPYLTGGNIFVSVAGDVDASNSVRLQKSTNSGTSWATVATYNSAQTNAAVAVAQGEQYRLITVVMQALKTIHYKLTAES